MKGKLIEVKDFIPIDINTTKKEFDKIMNVPNTQWANIISDINVVNNTNLPLTLRTFKLNTLPYIIIKILKK